MEKIIFVQYEDGNYGYIASNELDELIFSGKIKRFLRLNRWIIIGCSPIRIKQLPYDGTERRK